MENDLKELKSYLYKMIDLINYAENVTSLPDCNDCGRKSCSYQPRPGEWTRINCAHWIPREK